MSGVSFKLCKWLLARAHRMTAPTSVLSALSSLFLLALPGKPSFPSFFHNPLWRTPLRERLTRKQGLNGMAVLGSDHPAATLCSGLPAHTAAERLFQEGCEGAPATFPTKRCLSGSQGQVSLRINYKIATRN